CILHNICLKRQDYFVNVDQINLPDEVNDVGRRDGTNGSRAAGAAKRENLVTILNRDTHVRDFENIQQRFLKSAFYALDEGYPEKSFPQRELPMRFGVLDLKTRIDVQDVLYLFKLLNDEVNCSELLEQIGIRAPRHGLRVSHCFHLPPN
ncbi:hypothetical protein PV326_001534, partial [Microctonus aethiopoides]